jgi:hypothetical protein
MLTFTPDGRRAYVALQENNALGVVDLDTHTATRLIGLGSQDFNLSGNEIDPNDDDRVVSFVNVPVRGLFMPDAIATYTVGGRNFIVLANEGDFREDDADRTTIGGTSLQSRLRVTRDGSFAAGTRSFSIRDEDGNVVFDSGSALDRLAHAAGLYDDGRSRDRGVEPDGVALLEMQGRMYAFIGLERTLGGATAVYDITDPAAASFMRLLVTDGSGGTARLLRPEGLTAFEMDGGYCLAVANEGIGGANPQAGTALFALAPVPEPEAWAMLAAGLVLIGAVARRRSARAAPLAAGRSDQTSKRPPCGGTRTRQRSPSWMRRRSASAASASPWTTKVWRGARAKPRSHCISPCASAWPEKTSRWLTCARTGTCSPWILTLGSPPTSRAPRLPPTWKPGKTMWWRGSGAIALRWCSTRPPVAMPLAEMTIAG